MHASIPISRETQRHTQHRAWRDTQKKQGDAARSIDGVFGTALGHSCSLRDETPACTDEHERSRRPKKDPIRVTRVCYTYAQERYGEKDP